MIQGERDGEAGIPAADSSEITSYEKQLIQSFERQVHLVSWRFTEKENELYSSFKM